MKEISNNPKRQALIDTAIELFSQEGFWNTTTARIAQQAGVATGTLFTSFPSKNDLIDEVYSTIKLEAIYSIQDNKDKELSIEECFRSNCFNYLLWCVQNPEKYFLKHQLFQENVVSQRMQDSLADVIRYDDFFQKGIDSGEIIRLDTELLLTMVGNYLDVAA